ncbi:MAG: hypothetical protein WBB19_08985 [Desulforhopalus sp.]
MSFSKSTVNCVRPCHRYLIMACLLCGLLLHSNLGKCSAAPDTKPEPIQKTEAFKKELSDKWGIEVTALRMTAEGHMIDFRYRVLNKEKAAPLHNRQTKPYLVHKESGKTLAVPNTAKVGALRNSNMPQENRIYWMFFGNSGVVKGGDKVSIVIGDFRIDDLIVE